MRSFRIGCILFLLFLLPNLSLAADNSRGAGTALDEYVAKPDPAYSWKLVNTIKGDGVTGYVIDMTSQNWRKPPEVNRSLWQHYLVVYKPDEVKFDTGLLWIGGGANGSAPPNRLDPQRVFMAKTTQSVVAELGQIPNQPLEFYGDGKGRKEDDLIAYCYIKFMDTGDPTWIPRLPMVKSAVRAMDTITAFLASEAGGKTKVDKFVVAGGSKRGWTTWLTGAADKRVVAIIPIVIDVVNVRVSMIHHFEALGFFAQAVGDYTNHKVNERMDTKAYADLLKNEDPYSFRDRFTMPKYIVNASGDQYFMPDSSQFYFDDLPGVKYLRYVPNANHSLRDSDALQGITTFYQAILKGSELPKFSWKLSKDGVLRVKTETKPQEVNLWQANNPKARDFRLENIGAAYKKTPLASVEDGVYIAKVDKPEKGWTAFYVELTFPSGEKIPYKFSTPVGVVPDVLPHNIEEFRKTIK